MRQGLIFTLIVIMLGVSFPEKEVQSAGLYEMIPDEAIRLRILANSDSEADQNMKYLVRNEVSQYVSALVAEIDDIEEARLKIKKHVPKISTIIAETLEKNHAHDSFTVEYSKDVPFPTKVYGNFVYPEGEYEAVLITLGEGEGANWWCVLFPPLCFLDFSGNGVNDEENEENINLEDEPETESTEDNREVSFFLLEWLK